MPDPKDWTPSLPIRADASPEQMAARYWALYDGKVGAYAHPAAGIKLAREFADARLDDQRERIEADRAAQFHDFTSKPCNLCGGPRNWSLNGYPQAVCYKCGDPEPRVSADRGARSQDAEIEALERERDDLQTELSAKVSARDVKIQRLEAELADSRAPRDGTIASDSRLAAILHQLELGEASTGDVRDVAWCAKELRAYIEAEVLDTAPPVSQPEPSADTARLNWLEETHRANRLPLSIVTNGITDAIHILDDDESLLGSGSSLRDALDAAREAKEPTNG